MSYTIGKGGIMLENKKDAFYFSHDSNARHDVKMAKLRRQLGAEGYGIYWMIIESLREQSTYSLLLSTIPDLAYEYHVDEVKVTSLINDYDLFEITDGSFHSRRLLRSMNEYNDRKSKLSEAGKKGNEKRWEKQQGNSAIATQSPGDSNPIALKQRKVKEKKKKKVFIAPSIDDVCLYFKANGYSEQSAKTAFNYYNVSDWHDVNGKPVSNWKQKMISVWFKDEHKIKTGQPAKFVS